MKKEIAVMVLGGVYSKPNPSSKQHLEGSVIKHNEKEEK